MKALVFKIPVIEDCSVYVQEDRLPYFYDHLHLHPEIQLTYVLNGAGALFAGNYTGRFAPGDIYWISSNQPHLFKCDPVYFSEASPGQAHSLSIYFRQSGVLDHLFGLPELRETGDFIRKNTGVYKSLRKPDETLEALFRNMLNSRGSRRIVALLQLLQQFVFDTPKETLSGEEARGLKEQSYVRMNDVYQFTMRHFHEKISLEKVAGIAHMTPQAFCRYFRRGTRKTYMHFLNEVRINHARKLICDKENIPLSQVAAACGFENASGFSRTFRRVAGMTPLAYRKKFRESIS